MFGSKSKKKTPKGYKKAEKKAEEISDSKEEIRIMLRKGIEKALDNKEKLPFWDDLQKLFRLVKSYVNGEYRDVSPKSILAVLAAIIYFIMPFDVIPDFIPLLGFTDDAAVIVFVVNRIKDELEKFRDWETA